MTTLNPHSTVLASPAGSQATGAATTSAVGAVVVASSKGMAKVAKGVSAMVLAQAVRAKAKEALTATAHATKAVQVVAADQVVAVAKVVSLIPCAPALTPWANAAVTADAVVEAVAVVANPVAVVGVLTHCAPALAASNKLAA